MDEPVKRQDGLADGAPVSAHVTKTLRRVLLHRYLGDLALFWRYLATSAAVIGWRSSIFQEKSNLRTGERQVENGRNAGLAVLAGRVLRWGF